jgi:3-oxoacyl-[acyl-carrier protein] reductase
MDLKLKGKRALVTGASRGLGFATALGLASEGVRVAINSRNPESSANAAQTIQEQTGLQVTSLPGDVTDPQTTERLVQQAQEALGGARSPGDQCGRPTFGEI